MNLFDEIANTVAKSTEIPINTLAIDDNLDDDLDGEFALEAKTKLTDEILEGLSEEEIKALEEAGAEEEDEDDGLEEESVDSLLQNYVEDAYPAEAALDDEDLDDIEDDFDDDDL